MDVETRNSIEKNISGINSIRLFADQRPVEGPTAAINLNVLFDQKNFDAGAYPQKLPEIAYIRQLV